MLQEVEWSDDRSYRSGSKNEPFQFYLDALCNSTQFDLLLGYFSSAAINVLSLGFALFLYKGGKLRLVANNILSEADREAIQKAERGGIPSGILDLRDLRQLKNALDEYGQHFFECLAWLIANGRIQIKIIKPKSRMGIAHYKSGLFSDGADAVAFKASCNFTAYGLLENLEELNAFFDWEGGQLKKIVDRQQHEFEILFSGKADFVEYVDPMDILVAIKDVFGDKTLEELLIQEKKLLERKSLALENKGVKKAFDHFTSLLEALMREPRFPYPSGPREYQLTAYQNWVNNGHKGIFAMATGTGKTITSLNCLLAEYQQNRSYKAIILVPTRALVQQWKKECIKFNFKNIITVTSKENWNDNLSFFNLADTLIEVSFIVIVTYASFSRPKFKNHLLSLPPDTLLIADEVHNMGSPRIAKLLPSIHLEKRIGLSATPFRQYDYEGNADLERFFNDRPPYIYSFSMRQALDLGWLCQYTYFPHLVELTNEELKEYIKISKSLLKFMDPSTGRYKDLPEVEMLLLKRKRIIHKAVNKKDLFKKILRQEFQKKGNLKYTLVYVPEGIEADFEDTDQAEENEEETSLIDEYTRIVKDTDDRVMVRQFTALTDNRDALLKEFEQGKTHVLTSMKCLDEGVDLPRSELAIFCASTGNPRQFVQRRGRVLRTHRDKVHAVIHDLVVVARIDTQEGSYEMERNLFKKELERVVDFSELAMNKIDTYSELKQVLDHYNLNLNDIIKN